MSETILVQTQVDAVVAQRATAILEASGLTLSDAVQLLLTRTADEGAFPLASMTKDSAHDAWFRAQVQQALDDPRPGVSNEVVKAAFAERRRLLEELMPANPKNPPYTQDDIEAFVDEVRTEAYRARRH